MLFHEAEANHRLWWFCFCIRSQIIRLHHCTTSCYLYILVFLMIQLSQDLQTFYRNKQIVLVTNIFALNFLIIII